jgi:hypothetical protein
MCQFPVPMITNCQNITINYNIFPTKWLSFMSLHTFLFYCYSCWIDCLLLKFGSYIIFIRPQKFWGRIMVWRRRRLSFDLFNAHHIFFILLIATQNMKQKICKWIFIRLLNRLFVVKVWVLYYLYTTAKILGSYYGMAQSSSSVHILFRLSYFSSSFQ